MTLTPEQQQAVSEWVANGDNLSAIQKKLSEDFGLSLTYMDVRFLVDDLELTLKDQAPKADLTDVSKPPPSPPATPSPTDADAEAAPETDPVDEPAVLGEVSVEVDKVNLIPGAVASGSVTFRDGVTGKWMVDQYGRPGFTQISQPDYRPSPEDAQDFMRKLDATLQQQGM